LRNTYLDVEAFGILKRTFRAAVSRKKSRFAYGANFNLSVQRKGGCLSSLHILKSSKKEPEIHIYLKTFELPKKFFADLVFFNELIHELGIGECTVIIRSTTMFFWTINMPLLLPFFGFNGFKDEKFRENIIKNYNNRKHILSKRYKYSSYRAVWTQVMKMIDMYARRSGKSRKYILNRGAMSWMYPLLGLTG